MTYALITVIFLLLLLLILSLILGFRLFSGLQSRHLSEMESLTRSQKETTQSLLALISRQTDLLASKDPIAFQAISAVGDMAAPPAQAESRYLTEEEEVAQYRADRGLGKEELPGYDGDDPFTSAGLGTGQY